MPAQMSELLAMQRKRIDHLESEYGKVYERYERQITVSSQMRRQLSQLGTSPSSGDNLEESHSNETYKTRCIALENQLKSMSEDYSKKLIVA